MPVNRAIINFRKLKNLYLIRHAKSDWNDSSLSDFDRPLNERGKKAAPEMGKRLAKKKIEPDLICSSPAKRAITTARKIAEEINFDPDKIKEIKEIYEATVKNLLEVVNDIPEKHKSVFIVGHNPGLTDFANYLSNAHLMNIPTCGVVHIQFDNLHWKEISAMTGKMIEFDFPRKDE
jgi:phosphohistidine phosphatase